MSYKTNAVHISSMKSSLSNLQEKLLSFYFHSSHTRKLRCNLHWYFAFMNKQTMTSRVKVTWHACENTDKEDS